MPYKWSYLLTYLLIKSLRYSLKTIFNMAALRHFEFAKFWHFVTWLFLEPKFESAHQISLKSDDSWIAIKLFSKWRLSAICCAVNHIASYVPNIVLNFHLDWFSTFWYTWTFMFHNFGLKLPIWGQTFTVLGATFVSLHTITRWFDKQQSSTLLFVVWFLFFFHQIWKVAGKFRPNADE